MNGRQVWPYDRTRQFIDRTCQCSARYRWRQVEHAGPGCARVPGRTRSASATAPTRCSIPRVCAGPNLNDPDARVSCRGASPRWCLALRGGSPASAPKHRHSSSHASLPVGAASAPWTLWSRHRRNGRSGRGAARTLPPARSAIPPEVEAHPAPGDRVRIEIAGNASPFSVEYSASLMVLHFRAQTRGRFAATSLNLTHSPDDVDGLARLARL